MTDDDHFFFNARHFLEGLEGILEHECPEDMELDCDQDRLLISIGGKQMLITLHSPTSQIWLSSPLSGASHYSLEAGVWISTRNPSLNLGAVLEGELAKLTHRPWSLSKLGGLS